MADPIYTNAGVVFMNPYERKLDSPAEVSKCSAQNTDIHAWNVAIRMISEASLHIANPGDYFNHEFCGHPSIGVKAKEILKASGWEVQLCKRMWHFDKVFPGDPERPIVQRENDESMEDFCKRADEAKDLEKSHRWELWLRYPIQQEQETTV